MPSSIPLTRRQFAVKTAQGALALGAMGGVPARAATGIAPTGGIWKIRRNPKALAAPLVDPAEAQWRYALNYPFQVTPTLGGLYCSTKPFPSPGQDFGGGSDIILFDRPGTIDARRAVTVSRPFLAPNPNNGGRLAQMIRSPGMIGFVPQGALGTDGRPHPHAGTGFALVTTIAWPAGPGEMPGFTDPDRIGYGAYTGERSYRCFDLFQLRYEDGAGLTVGPAERIEMQGAVEGFQLASTGMGCALADGEDLLTGMTAVRTGSTASVGGVLRWRCHGVWRPVSYEPATPEDNSMEPSLIRDRDGSLLLFSRAPRAMGPPVRLWRQRAAGGSWEPLLNLNGLIPSVPATLSRAVDGTPYFSANLYQPQYFLPPTLHAAGGVSRLEPVGRRGERSLLCLWPLNEERDGFSGQLVIRDPLVEFGRPPHGTIWAADHPTGAVVRLADGHWHALLGYRVLEWKENTHMTPPGPCTGSYLDEVLSIGDPVPLWDF